jgi:putative aminopeptidase FrvX
VDRRQTWLDVAESLLSRPTAPLVEELPAAVVSAFAEARPGLSTGRDAAGNVVVRYQGEGADPDRPLVLVAHLDHPGFVVTEVSARTATLEFRGGLAASNAVAGSPVELFHPGSPEAVGHGELVAADEHEGRLKGATATILDGGAEPGDVAMWRFPGFSVVDDRITGRVCDDLLGAAVVLCALDELARRRPAGAAVWGLFTRGEEIGFLGALEAIRLRTVPAGARVLSVECSKALADAPQGGGVIVRVGDRTSIFDPGLTAALVRAAGEVAGADPAFRWQRKLMDGGTCEASVFCACGYRASGLALPLGNYHNGLDTGRGVGPEHVTVDDYAAGVRLATELALSPHLLDDTHGDGFPAWLGPLQERARAELGAGERAPAAEVV